VCRTLTMQANVAFYILDLIADYPNQFLGSKLLIRQFSGEYNK